MQRSMTFKTFLLAASCSFVFPAYAQVGESSATKERVERLERDIMLLQRQISRGTPSSAPISQADLPPEGAAQLEVRLSSMEEEIRRLVGKVEESEFQVKKLTENLEKFQKDTEFRFNDAAGAAQPDAYAAEAGEPTAAAAKPALAKPAVDPKDDGKRLPSQQEKRKPLNGQQPVHDTTAEISETTPPSEAPATDDKQPTSAGDGVLRVPEKQVDGNFATPRDLYNYGFRMLNQTQYDESANAFQKFTKKYPKDPLVGNAYYWLGESHYIRRDYVKAADSFRQGFEALPSGPKAPDNLLKLSMSLDALNRDKEACVVLQQIILKFKTSAAGVVKRAEQEKKRIGCS